MRPIVPPPHGIIEITNAKDPAKTVIAVKGENHSVGCYVKTVDIKMLEEKEILIDLIEERNIQGKPASLPLRFRYHPETGSAYIGQVMEGRNDTITEFYFHLWFCDENAPLDVAVTDASDGGPTQVTVNAIADSVRAVGNNREAYVELPRKTVYTPMDFVIVVWWKGIIKAASKRQLTGIFSSWFTSLKASACFLVQSLSGRTILKPNPKSMPSKPGLGKDGGGLWNNLE